MANVHVGESCRSKHDLGKCAGEKQNEKGPPPHLAEIQAGSPEVQGVAQVHPGKPTGRLVSSSRKDIAMKARPVATGISAACIFVKEATATTEAHAASAIQRRGGDVDR